MRLSTQATSEQLGQKLVTKYNKLESGFMEQFWQEGILSLPVVFVQISSLVFKNVSKALKKVWLEM